MLHSVHCRSDRAVLNYDIVPAYAKLTRIRYILRSKYLTCPCTLSCPLLWALYSTYSKGTERVVISEYTNPTRPESAGEVSYPRGLDEDNIIFIIPHDGMIVAMSESPSFTTKKLACRTCHRAFSKPEHLRVY